MISAVVARSPPPSLVKSDRCPSLSPPTAPIVAFPLALLQRTPLAQGRTSIAKNPIEAENEEIE